MHIARLERLINNLNLKEICQIDRYRILWIEHIDSSHAIPIEGAWLYDLIWPAADLNFAGSDRADLNSNIKSSQLQQSSSSSSGIIMLYV